MASRARRPGNKHWPPESRFARKPAYQVGLAGSFRCASRLASCDPRGRAATYTAHCNEFAATIACGLDVINRPGRKTAGEVIGLQEIVVRNITRSTELKEVIALDPTEVLGEVPLVSIEHARTGRLGRESDGISEKLCGAVARSRSLTRDFQRLLRPRLERCGVFATPAPPVAQE